MKNIIIKQINKDIVEAEFISLYLESYKSLPSVREIERWAGKAAEFRLETSKEARNRLQEKAYRSGKLYRGMPMGIPLYLWRAEHALHEGDRTLAQNEAVASLKAYCRAKYGTTPPKDLVKKLAGKIPEWTLRKIVLSKGKGQGGECNILQGFLQNHYGSEAIARYRIYGDGGAPTWENCLTLAGVTWPQASTEEQKALSIEGVSQILSIKGRNALAKRHGWCQYPEDTEETPLLWRGNLIHVAPSPRRLRGDGWEHDIQLPRGPLNWASETWQQCWVREARGPFNRDLSPQEWEDLQEDLQNQEFCNLLKEEYDARLEQMEQVRERIRVAYENLVTRTREERKEDHLGEEWEKKLRPDRPKAKKFPSSSKEVRARKRSGKDRR